MRFASASGDLLELTLDGYEFPLSSLPSSDGWDAAWLFVRGHVRRSDEAWRFRNPCLTVSEARRLLEWMRDGSPAPIEFLEPLLAFARHPEAGGRTRLIVTLCGEAAPPSMSKKARWNHGCTLAFDLTPRDLAAAAHEWEIQVDVHPER